MTFSEINGNYTAVEYFVLLLATVCLKKTNIRPDQITLLLLGFFEQEIGPTDRKIKYNVGVAQD